MDGRVLRYVNAGHNPQFVIRAHGGLDPLSSTGMPIALYAGHGYTEARVELDPSDLLFFYTDGLVETMNEAGDMFDVQRLQDLLTEDAGARGGRGARERRGTGRRVPRQHGTVRRCDDDGAADYGTDGEPGIARNTRTRTAENGAGEPFGQPSA